MKRSLLLVICVFWGFEVHSQVLISLLLGDKLNSDGLAFGLEGGYCMSGIASMDNDKSLSSLYLGFYFDIKIKEPWYLYTGVMVKSRQGADALSPADLEFLETEVYQQKGDYRQVLNYFNIPILAKYKFKNHMYVEAGPQVGLMHKAWVEFRSDANGKSARIREYNSDMIHKIDLGVSAGTGYQLKEGKGITIGLKYYLGLVDVYKDKSGTYNSALFVKVNIPIGAGNADIK
ncbi:MAG: PorT family protein [Cyclobacteriaceae bacterium]|nr:PorT family protein [Cyclobacteriaceae bacterium]